MFRKRPIIPRWRRQRAEPLARLQQAHALMAQGRYQPAAEIFSLLADGAAARRLPRAAQLNLQAGRAWLMAGDIPGGVYRLRQGLLLMARTGQAMRLPPVARRVLDEMTTRGLGQEAERLEAELRAALPDLRLQAAELSELTRPAGDAGGGSRRLPAKCPYCGASVIPGEVEWLDEATAACGYCGSAVLAEG